MVSVKVLSIVLFVHNITAKLEFISFMQEFVQAGDCIATKICSRHCYMMSGDSGKYRCEDLQYLSYNLCFMVSVCRKTTCGSIYFPALFCGVLRICNIILENWLLYNGKHLSVRILRRPLEHSPNTIRNKFMAPELHESL